MPTPVKLRSKDIDVRIAVTRALLAAGVDRCAIRHEITLDTSSSDGRADIVLALNHAIVGIEIKSGKDKLDLLDQQYGRYQTHFDRAMLVADSRFKPSFEWGGSQKRWNFCLFHHSDPGELTAFECTIGHGGDLRDIARIRKWERLVGLASKRGRSSLMHHSDAEGLGPEEAFAAANIDQMVEWSMTSREGRQYDWFRSVEEPTACSSSLGLCE